ncbi:aminopeptidase O-like [Apostichopus japonicus]|uniref:aminopeptidase O-like n=1 Tax=Stichopus japonicus TaxID=307972 RepID=UPI003AB506DF
MWNLDPGGLEPSKDLPLLSNTGDIRIRHYLINLDVKFTEKIFTGALIIFLEPASEKEKKDGILKSHGGDQSSEKQSNNVAEGNCSKDGAKYVGVIDKDGNNQEGEIGQDTNRVQMGQKEENGSMESESELVGKDLTNDSGDGIKKDKVLTPGCTEGKTHREWFTCILDCCDIVVDSVEEIKLDDHVKSIRDADKLLSSQNSNSRDVDNCEDRKEDKGPRKVFVESETKLSNLLGYRRCNFKERNAAFTACLHLPGESLSFKVSDWSLSIWKKGIKKVEDFPSVIRIVYSTMAKGHSFTWTFDQLGRECVFSQGAWINNRSLFPCQEPPGAMATWQAFIQTPKEYVVLMSGDEKAETRVTSTGMISSYYYVDMVMPPSMLAVAIGQWQGVDLPIDVKSSEQEDTIKIVYDHKSRCTTCDHEPWPCRINASHQPVIPARIFAPRSILPLAEEEFGGRIPGFLNAAFKILGPHPFSRLDLVILPRCFASMGLASPSIVFISQSLLSGDGSLCSRLAHEITHSWFGLLIGAMDWTEEWLSEGFATFLEDPVQSIAENWTKEKFHEISNLRALLRFKALKAEIENTASELQIMRPMGDQSHMRNALLVGYVKNGRHPDKWFLQVHYLKGYFLLHYISDIVGLESLLHVMSTYVSTFHGRLVLSREFFKILFDMCPKLSENGINQDVIDKEWLDSPGIPKILNQERFIKGNKLIEQVVSEVTKWETVDTHFRIKDKGKLKKKTCPELPEVNVNLSSEQLCLLLEHLLQSGRLRQKTLAKLREDFELHLKNAEIRHRWCELVIKHRFMDGYGDIRMFLLKDQSMGVYLYGELLASEDSIQRLLAETCYEAVATVMDRGCRRTVEEMLGIQQSK